MCECGFTCALARLRVQDRTPLWSPQVEVPLDLILALSTKPDDVITNIVLSDVKFIANSDSAIRFPLNPNITPCSYLVLITLPKG